MSKKVHVYRTGSKYRAIEDQIRAAGSKGVSKEELLANHASADVGVVISPTESSTRGDCRGNFSAQGHKYFIARLKNKNLVWRFRKVEMEPNKRPEKAKVAQTKKADTKVTVKSKAKTATVKA